MYNVKEEKVFRRKGKEPSDSANTFMALIALPAVLSFIVALVSFIKSLFLHSFYLLMVVCESMIVFLLLVMLVAFIFDITSSPSYTLTLEENKLVYEDDSKSVVLQLPCSYEKRSTTIKLCNDNTEINLDYTEPEEAELLEFLKDVIN